MERLQKVLAHRGVASRRKSEELIKQGKVKVNGKVVTELGVKVDPKKDKICVNGRLIPFLEKKVYVLLYKPPGYVTTLSDPQGRKTVKDLVKKIPERIYPVGRLDYDTEGLLLLTNDGELSYKLTHPSFEVKKTYLVKVKGIPSEDTLKKLREGVKLSDGITAPAQVKFLKKFKENSLLEITIHEGRNRQIRRMCKKVGHPVLWLKRTKLAFLNLGSLKKGEYRFLTKKEVAALKKI